MTELYSKTEMIGAVRVFLESQGFTLQDDYDPIFEPARVPVFASKENRSEGGEVFVDIITEPQIKSGDYFKDRLFGRTLSGDGLKLPHASSAQFFRHYFPNAEVYWAIPDYSKRDKGIDDFQKKCEEEHVGLLEVKKDPGNGFTAIKIGDFALPLLQERSNKVRKHLEQTISDQHYAKLEKLFKRWSDDDLAYLVFYPEPRYTSTDISARDQESNISRELINKMTDLKNVWYKGTLIKFAKTYYSKSEDDYAIALRVTEELWQNYKIVFPNLHKDFEQILKLDPRYRDHFLHAFQVFLYGVYVIDEIYDACKQHFGKSKGCRIEDAWVICATYHDFNYMIQQFDKWTKSFFISALYLDEEDKSPAILNLGESYVKRGYMFKTKILADILSLEVNHVTLDFLYDRILEKKNHGLISALSLLKYLDLKGCKKLSKKAIRSACKAISIHDSDIWQSLCGLAPDSDDKVGNRFKKLKAIKRISFDNDPIPFLLILSDSIQEEGRSKPGQCKIELDKLYAENGKIFSQISFQGNEASEVFKRKIEELETVKKFLDGGTRFNVLLADTEGDLNHQFKI